MTSVIDCRHKPLSDAYFETASATANTTVTTAIQDGTTSSLSPGETGVSQASGALLSLAPSLWGSLVVIGIATLVSTNV